MRQKSRVASYAFPGACFATSIIPAFAIHCKVIFSALRRVYGCLQKMRTIPQVERVAPPHPFPKESTMPAMRVCTG